MCMCVAIMYVRLPESCNNHRGQRKTSDSSRTGVTDSCWPPCGCWDLNSGTLQEVELETVSGTCKVLNKLQVE